MKVGSALNFGGTRLEVELSDLIFYLILLTFMILLALGWEGELVFLFSFWLKVHIWSNLVWELCWAFWVDRCHCRFLWYLWFFLMLLIFWFNWQFWWHFVWGGAGVAVGCCGRPCWGLVRRVCCGFIMFWWRSWRRGGGSWIFIDS